MRRFRNLSFLLVILIGIIPLFDLFHPGLPFTHDGQDHVIRLANFYQNLSEGNVIPRWAANVNYGYGHPVLMFFYPLPYYVGSIIHSLGFSFIDSIKLAFGIAYVFSGLTMFLWVNEFLGKRAAFAGALLYLLAPYRFVDLYVRGAIGEHVAFLFPPLIVYFLLRLSKRYSYWYLLGGSLSFAGLILSHNAMSLMFLPLIFLYILYLLWQTNLKRYFILNTLYLILLAFGLSAFFWMPAFFEAKYTLRDIVTSGEYASRFIPFGSFVYGSWNYGGSGEFTTQVGTLQLVAVFASLFALVGFYQKRNKLWIISAGLLVVLSFTLFLMTEASNTIWQTVTILQKFQFPWRFLSLTVFITAILGGIAIFAIPGKFQLFACGFLLLSLLWFNKDYSHAKGYLIREDSFFTAVQRTTTNDTGESSPIWSVRFMEKPPAAHMEVIDGNAKIAELKRVSTYHEYKVEAEETTRVRENTLYFPGWETFVDGKKVSIEFQDPANRGLITFFVSKGDHIIEVTFKETRLRFFANFVSLASVVVVCLGVVYSWKKKLLV